MFLKYLLKNLDELGLIIARNLNQTKFGRQELNQ